MEKDQEKEATDQANPKVAVRKGSANKLPCNFVRGSKGND